MRTARGCFTITDRDRDGRGGFSITEPDVLAIADPLPHSECAADLRRAHALQP
jgi:hypothetical protein